MGIVLGASKLWEETEAILVVLPFLSLEWDFGNLPPPPLRPSLAPLWPSATPP